MVWYPPTDIIPDYTTIYEDYNNGYWLLFYYASMYLFNIDMLPRTYVEELFNVLFILIGNITMSILIGQLSDILSQITKKSR